MPQSEEAPVLMARVWNDGFEKLKNQRVARAGDQLPEVKRCFTARMAGQFFVSPLAVTVPGANLQGGTEWSPQEWLPQPQPEATKEEEEDKETEASETRRAGVPSKSGVPSAQALGWKPGFGLLGWEQQQVLGAIFRAVAELPDLAGAVLADFGGSWRDLPPLPLGRPAVLKDFFHVLNGKSAGEKHYRAGALPYVSSGGLSNSIVRLVDVSDGEREGELFRDGALTVTAFGQATVQPWPLVARGNGGSSVRVLTPRYRMGLAELVWFAAQINAQRWRFFYARMAIKSRLERLVVSSPPACLPQGPKSIAARIQELRDKLVELSVP